MAPHVSGRLADAPRLQVLATSRPALHLRAEQQFPIAPLPVPDLTRLLPGANLAQVPAVALFLARARAVDPDFTLTATNARAGARICVRLDSLPLALELAAARIAVLPPAALLARLNHPLALLTGGAADLPAGRPDLRGAIDASYTLLDAAEQALFRRLAVFAGGGSLEAVEAVCRLPGDPATDRLAAASLLRRQPTRDDAPRYQMLETIREYAEEHLVATGEEPATDEHPSHLAVDRGAVLVSAQGATPACGGPARGR